MILRNLIEKYKGSREVGPIWNKLALFFVRTGEFGLARDIFEEALADIRSVQDFSIVFNAYVQFEKQVMTVEGTLLESPD